MGLVKKLLLMMALVLSIPAGAGAATVSGTLVTSDGSPVANRQLHFENRVTGDLYLVRTAADGGFSADLPPGVYDLRQQEGEIIRAGVGVVESPDTLGKVSEPGFGSFWSHLFDHEELAPGIIRSPAPSTANLGGTHSAPQPAASPEATAPANPSAP